MEELAKHERFSKHATYFIQMIDKALGMLGPDIELLTEILMDLGLKHAKVTSVGFVAATRETLESHCRLHFFAYFSDVVVWGQARVFPVHGPSSDSLC